MKHLYISLILFFLVVAEGVFPAFLPGSLTNGEWLIVPHWVLIYLVMIAVFYDHDHSYFCVLYGMVFGMIIDIVYTDILGVYMFFYAISAYAAHGLKKMLHANFYVAGVLTVFAVGMADTSVHILYTLTGDETLELVWFLDKRLFPTVVANLILFMVIYPFSKHFLEKWGTGKQNRTRMAA